MGWLMGLPLPIRAAVCAGILLVLFLLLQVLIYRHALTHPAVAIAALLSSCLAAAALGTGIAWYLEILRPSPVTDLETRDETS